MFYSYDLLCLRKKGRYSIIWYAATHGSPPRKMDLTRVSIAATCEELMDAIKIPAKKKNEPLRLSLYLSSMLMHGACIVYREQVILLLHDTMHFMEKFHQSAASKIAILMRNMDKREGEMADEERRGKRAGAPRRNKREMARDAAAVPALPELAPPPPPPGLDEEAVMRQLEAQAQSAPPKAPPLFLEPQEDAARTRALGLELAQAAQPLPGAQHELFSTTDPRLLAQIVELEGASRAGEREPMAEEKEKAEVQEEAEEEKEGPTVLEEVAAAAPVAMSTPLPLLAPPPATLLPALEIEPVPEQFPAAGEASKAPSEAEAAAAVGLAEQQEAEQEPPPAPPATPATPTRRPAPPLGHPEAPPRKRPRLFPRCPAFSEDEETRWHRHVLAQLPPPTRVAGAVGDVAAAPAPAAAATVAAAWSSRFDDLRRAQEFVRVRRRLDSPTHAADASTEFALHASSRAGSFSHLSSVSMDQSEIKRIQGQLKAIPELGDATTSSLLQPVREDAAEEAAAAVGGVEPPPEAPELPPPAEVPAPMEVDEPAPAPLPADVSELPPPPEEQPVILEEMQPPDLVAAREYETVEQLQPHLSHRTNWELSRQTILEKLHKLWLSGNGATTFDLLCPRAVPRVRVAVTFNILLHLHKDKTLKLQQEQPFETICIHKK